MDALPMKKDQKIEKWTCPRCGWETQSSIKQANHELYHALTGD
jgi:hypothetical protein